MVKWGKPHPQRKRQVEERQVEGRPRFHLPQKPLAEGKWDFRGVLATAPFLTRTKGMLKEIIGR